jgi:cold shock protein
VFDSGAAICATGPANRLGSPCRAYPVSLRSIGRLQAVPLPGCHTRGRSAPAPHEEGRLLRMAIGTVKWFNPTKGFGFIAPQDGGKDVFVHITAVQKAGLQGLDENQKVSYDVVTERGKAAAANLKPL